MQRCIAHPISEIFVESTRTDSILVATEEGAVQIDLRFGIARVKVEIRYTFEIHYNID
jgi:hypothetical protein